MARRALGKCPTTSTDDFAARTYFTSPSLVIYSRESSVHGPARPGVRGVYFRICVLEFVCCESSRYILYFNIFFQRCTRLRGFTGVV